MITTESIQSGIKRLAQAMEQSADELNTADGLLGDGDLGVTMIRGFRQIIADLETLPEDIGMAFFPVCQGFHQKLRFQLRNLACYRDAGHSKSKKRTNWN